MRPKGSPKELERRRRFAIRLLKQGMRPYEIAHKVKVQRRSIRRWNAAYHKGGYKAIRAKAAGRPRKLGEHERKSLVRKLLKGAKNSGFATSLWTCPRIAKLISSQFGVRYHVDHIGRLLRSLGWSPQKPQRRAIERDEKEIQRWTREEWPLIKKKPRG